MGFLSVVYFSAPFRSPSLHMCHPHRQAIIRDVDFPGKEMWSVLVLANKLWLGLFSLRILCLLEMMMSSFLNLFFCGGIFYTKSCPDTKEEKFCRTDARSPVMTIMQLFSPNNKNEPRAASPGVTAAVIHETWRLFSITDKQLFTQEVLDVDKR